jgi:hypothetical protein
VLLLTNPVSAGYTQNPISVYYCYGRREQQEQQQKQQQQQERQQDRRQQQQHEQQQHDRPRQLGDGATPLVAIAEVTNTPWGDRVRFVFRPEGDESPKALHVSPFMDMENTWWAPEGWLQGALGVGVLWVAGHQQRVSSGCVLHQGRHAATAGVYRIQRATAAVSWRGRGRAPGLAQRFQAGAHLLDPPSALLPHGNARHLRATPPGEGLKLSVVVTHPRLGQYFDAHLIAKRCSGPHATALNEAAGWGSLLRWVRKHIATPAWPGRSAAGRKARRRRALLLWGASAEGRSKPLANAPGPQPEPGPGCSASDLCARHS